MDSFDSVGVIANKTHVVRLEQIPFVFTVERRNYHTYLVYGIKITLAVPDPGGGGHRGQPPNLPQNLIFTIIFLKNSVNFVQG